MGVSTGQQITKRPRQKVRLKLPEGARAKKVQLLVGGQTPRTEESAGWLTLTVPSILYHEVVAMDV